jgi:hypothetical protein
MAIENSLSRLTLALELYLDDLFHSFLNLVIALPLVPSIAVNLCALFTARLAVSEILTSTLLVAPISIEDTSTAKVGHCGAVATV